MPCLSTKTKKKKKEIHTRHSGVLLCVDIQLWAHVRACAFSFLFSFLFLSFFYERDQKVHQQPEKRLSANNKVGSKIMQIFISPNNNKRNVSFFFPLQKLIGVLISNSVCFILMFGVKAGNKVVGKARRRGQRSMKVNVSVKHIESAGMRVNNTTATSSSLSLYYLKTSLSSIA